MKNVLKFLSILSVFILCGCENNKDVMKDIVKKVNNCDSYHLTATLEISRNEELYTYDIDSSYQKEDNFKVILTNKNNNHEQIILKNDQGVYVLTPSLNKSFKFQSDWPYNNSQIYLLQPVISDIENDNNAKLKKIKDGYIITSKVEYSTEKDFETQKVYLDKDGNITKIEVLDKSKNVKMALKIIEIDYKAKFDKNHFSSEEYEKNIEENTNKNKKLESENQNNTGDENTKNNSSETNDNSVAKIEEIVYPMYVPSDTYLSEQNVVNTETGERAILTFTGESSFTLIQETIKKEDETNYVYGDPYIIMDTVGSLTPDSVSWISNGMEYSVMSDTMDLDEILTVAQSISVTAVSK